MITFRYTVATPATTNTSVTASTAAFVAAEQSLASRPGTAAGVQRHSSSAGAGAGVGAEVAVPGVTGEVIDGRHVQTVRFADTVGAYAGGDGGDAHSDPENANTRRETYVASCTLQCAHRAHRAHPSLLTMRCASSAFVALLLFLPHFVSGETRCTRKYFAGGLMIVVTHAATAAEEIVAHSFPLL